MKPKILMIAAVVLALLAAGVLLFQRSNSGPAQSGLVFFGKVCLGPDRTNKDMVLNFIVEGTSIFLDRNKDDIAQDEEKLAASELDLIDDPAAGVNYQIKELRLTKGQDFVSETLPQNLAMTVVISGKVDYEQTGQVVMSTQPQAADWIHFHGKNRVLFADPDIQLTAGETIQLRTFFGTNAIGKGADLGKPEILQADKDLNLAELSPTDRFATILPQANSLHPELTIEIPTTGETYVERIPLNEFC